MICEESLYSSTHNFQKQKNSLYAQFSPNAREENFLGFLQFSLEIQDFLINVACPNFCERLVPVDAKDKKHPQ